jgi:hypothetical protein
MTTFRRPRFRVKMEAVMSSETSVPYHNTTQGHKSEDLDLNPLKN